MGYHWMPAIDGQVSTCTRMYMYIYIYVHAYVSVNAIHILYM